MWIKITPPDVGRKGRGWGKELPPDSRGATTEGRSGANLLKQRRSVVKSGLRFC
jgi:hypothetical protein